MNEVTMALRRALRHPGLIVALFCLRTAFAAAGSVLWLGAFAPAWVMGLARKDASLLQPGLLLPIRLFAENRLQWTDCARNSLWLVLAYIVAGTIVIAVVLQAMSGATESGKARRKWPAPESLARQLAAVGISWVLVLLAIYVTQHLARILPPLTYQFFGEKGADAALLVSMTLLVLASVVIRLACDLTRAGLTRSRQPLTDVVVTAASELRARWGFWLGSYACFLLPSIGLPLLVGIWFPWFGDQPRTGLGRVLVQQAVVLASCALQLGWWSLVLTHAPVPNQPEE